MGLFLRAQQLVWQYGGRREKVVLTLYPVTTIVLLAVTAWIFWNVWNFALPWELLVNFAIAAGTYGAFHLTFAAALLNAGILKELLRRGHLRPNEGQFAEYVRYLEDHGNGGRLPQIHLWAAVYWTIYYVMLAVAFIFTKQVLPTFGQFTPVAFIGLYAPIAFGCLFAFLSWTKNVVRRANALGYSLSGLISPAVGLER